MDPHKFGSEWTQAKLNCVEEYSQAWSKIMYSQKSKYGWHTRYIDAFSGSGTYSPKHVAPQGEGALFDEMAETQAERKQLLAGSASLAIATDPPFDRIDLIESKKAYATQLRQLADNDLNERVFVHQNDANQVLASLAEQLGKNERALVFIDPYGCDVAWQTLQKIAASKVCDVWYLFPTMGVNRQLQSTLEDIPDYKRQSLDRVLGTSSWRQAFYETDIQLDLFGEQRKQTRDAGPSRVEAFFIERLKLIFPAVHDECLQLKNSRNGHLFSLCFAVSNPRKAAQTVALRIAASVIKKWSKI